MWKNIYLRIPRESKVKTKSQMKTGFRRRLPREVKKEKSNTRKIMKIGRTKNVIGERGKTLRMITIW